MNVAEALSTVGTINTTESVTDFIHTDFKQLAAKVLKEKQQDRDNYLEMEQRYREDKGGEQEEDSDSEEPVQFNSKRHHRVTKKLLKYNFYIDKLDGRYMLSEQRKLERGKGKKITDEQHGWLIVLGKPAENFDLDLFFERYPEAVGYVRKIRDICGKRITEWDNANPQDPVNKANWREKKLLLLSTSMMSNTMMMKKPQEHLPMKVKLQTNMFLRVKTQLNYLRACYQNENVPEAAEMRTVYVLVLAKCFWFTP